MTDYVDSLARVPLFAHCSSRDLARIARAVDQIEVEAGRVLISEGDIGRESFMILTGEVEVTRNGDRVATLGPGQPFGEMALIEHEPRNATVTVTRPGTVLVLGQREFSGLIDEPSFAKAIMIALADRVRKLDQSYVG